MSDSIKRANAVQIHEDGTLEVKVPNAHKVGRVLVMDTDSHIGGGLFYQDDAEAVPQSDQYKKGFEDAKRAFELEFAREAESIRKQNAQLEVTLNIQKKLSADEKWIPCSKRLPKDLEAVNVTWVNHNPTVDYQHIKDVPKADTAVYYRGMWYWWNATIIDLLGEYDGAYVHDIKPIDKDIEVTAWQPLPKPYKESEVEK